MRLERGESPIGLRPGETIEQGVKRLERELEELREANYILKKPNGFYGGPVTERKPREIYSLDSGKLWQTQRGSVLRDVGRETRRLLRTAKASYE